MWLTVKECATLPGFPAMEHNIRSRLDKAAKGVTGLRRRREGTKAFEYHIDCLPIAAQEQVRARFVQQMMTKPNISATVPTLVSPATKGRDEGKIALYRQCPALMEQKLVEFNTAQRAVADARIVLVSEVLRLGAVPGYSCAKAIREIVRLAQANDLPSHLAQAAAQANAKKGKTRALSEITLKRCVADFNKASSPAERLVLLAPGKRQPVKLEAIPWFSDFMAHFRDTNGILMTEAYEAFKAEWCACYADQPDMMAAIPSYDTICYQMKKLPAVVKQQGRVTGSESRQIEGFVRRDWNSLPVNYVWIGDGHGMKMKVAHPDHGNPFTPEVTFVMDGSCRFITGWSLALSESVIAVADALRYGIKKEGKPFIYYSDNGGGETNNTFDADITGILPRLGIDHRTGIPENPQGRGIIERLNRSLAMRISRQFATYYGTGADRNTVRRMGKTLTSALNAQRKGRELTPVQKRALQGLPSWDELVAAIESGIEWYNNRPHSELPKTDSGEHFTPAQFRRYKLEQDKTAIEWLSDVELRDMFMPQIERTVNRCEVRLFNNFYYSLDLNHEHGNQVLVSYDIHDANRVIVRRMDGTYICDAVWDGNKKAAFAVTAEYHQRQQRIKGMRNRAEEKIRLAEAEGNRTLLSPVEEERLNNNIYRTIGNVVAVEQPVEEPVDIDVDSAFSAGIDRLYRKQLDDQI
ncbi:Mu transposase C-terminal domain-containing protein [Limnobaculum zhutongyuii]|uniref:Mu transposase C-terminal domain-containing protein n=1 Tax=Limnobaculum zhutongyuii TaxID=2498113 RepID=UPI0038991111